MKTIAIIIAVLGILLELLVYKNYSAAMWAFAYAMCVACWGM